MRLLIIGASGRTGKLATKYALERGHSVTALVRHINAVEGQDRLNVCLGSPLDPASVDAAFVTGMPDAVLVTLAASRETDSPFAKPKSPRFFMRDSMRNVIAAMQKHNVKKLVVMSSSGTGDSWSQLVWPLKLLFTYSNMKYQTEDHNAVDAEVRAASGLERTLVRPTVLKEDEAKDVREFGEMGKGIGMLDSITRKSVARYLIERAAKESVGCTTVVIAN